MHGEVLRGLWPSVAANLRGSWAAGLWAQNASQNDPQKGPGGLREGSRRGPGELWHLRGGLGGIPGASWRSPGGVLEAARAVLGAPWAVLGRSLGGSWGLGWGLMGVIFGAHFQDRFRTPFGTNFEPDLGPKSNPKSTREGSPGALRSDSPKMFKFAPLPHKMLIFTPRGDTQTSPKRLQTRLGSNMVNRTATKTPK